MKKLKKRQIFRFSAAVFCVILVIILQSISAIISSLLYYQQAAERWRGSSELKFSQISAFLRQEVNFDTNSITSLHEQIDTQLTSASLEASSNDARLWYDCYSSQGEQMEITGTRKKSAEALVTVVGGDFFTMHTPALADGSYFQKSDLMQDRAVIDTTLAWQLFGSSEVAGMEIQIRNRSCLIAGVIKPESDYATETAYGDTPRIYISYTLYQELQGGSAGTHIDCYEAVLPNPVKGFAKKLITESIDSEQNDRITILENTGRYNLSGRWEQLRHIRELVTSETVTYPYWENAARIICFDTAMLLFLSILLLLYPVIYFVWLCWKFYRFTDKTIWEKRIAFRNRYRPQIRYDLEQDQNSET